MLASRQRWFRQHGLLPILPIILPAIAGCIMLGASALPWLTDPLGKGYSAWKLSIDIGWQFRSSILNYGLLCLGCAIYAFVLAYAQWHSFRSVKNPPAGRNTTGVLPAGMGRLSSIHSGIAGLLCIMPVVLFLLQYLFADVGGINRLAQDEIQALLLRTHFGYSVAAQRISLDAFAVDGSTLQGRFVLLVNQLSIGVLLPCLSAWIVIHYRRFFAVSHRAVPRKRQYHRWLIGLLMLVGLIVLGRAPVAMACEYQAKASLAEGNYAPALGWLDTARSLNPALNQVASYHIERGQALYYLHPNQQSDDSRAYLAFTYSEKRDFVDAYQELLAFWQLHQPAPWIVDETSIVLERLAESTQALDGQPSIMPNNNDAALPWLQLLTQIDPSNVYGQYVLGRIEYDLHNYRVCSALMGTVIQLSHDADAQSSAYTYMALSDAGLGDYLGERTLLFKAVQLDPGSHNNTAREELSGLR